MINAFKWFERRQKYAKVWALGVATRWLRDSEDSRGIPWLRPSMSSFDTMYPADSLEFCPHPLYQDIFVCGTYKLDEVASAPDPPTSQHRRGQCLVFTVNGDLDRPTSKNIQIVDLPAVPDMKWCHRSESNPALLGVADSEGRLTLFEWNGQHRTLNQLEKIACAPPDVLCLSLDWSNRRFPRAGLGSLVVSLSNGCLAVLQANDQGSLDITESWHAHDYEPWVAAWDYWNVDLIYSGGDDLQWKCWDIRQGFTRPTFVNRRFEAGVTSIQSHPHREHIIAVGSYDNSVCLFDVRKAMSPISKVDVGGGAWRVKWHPSPTRPDDLLVACMHDGFKVLHFGAGDAEIMGRFDLHESLAYGVDWSFATNGASAGETLIGSCSFYDHKMCLWSG